MVGCINIYFQTFSQLIFLSISFVLSLGIIFSILKKNKFGKILTIIFHTFYFFVFFMQCIMFYFSEKTYSEISYLSVLRYTGRPIIEALILKFTIKNNNYFKN
ncbi:hypothetical protein DID80_07710 [Candidatus Marinamargulisbacteria bacterium SCGC AAA071-K20]|nr:hypothetical protein DID80_07710 [Candidatus Marinamargulisbacteria bacterium SCGC AAA071-K20]